ncbi:hypothetical protein BZJ19_10165 [Salinivibrio proteolyticus]|uniref:3'-5' exoribonuclease domain-containing protein n=1 Tax=Salinivibrio proteolyticus TaxID=334715 RepID=UPI0009C7BB7E|nr:3'-5' exoribonuclease [Salinivibrio proteolyticus]OOF25074.1 hypothetical protein BZJ19_10165 [Salinivibrio proteolyticus]
MPSNTVVFDLETFALKPDNALIASISGVKFDRFATPANVELEEFDAVLNLREQVFKGRVIEAGTVAWWNKPAQKEAMARILDAGTFACEPVLKDFVQFIEGCQVFCRGTDFDPPKLLSLARDFGVDVPVKYNAWRDVRTYIDALSGDTSGYIDLELDLVAHASLDDCKRDALQMINVRYNAFGTAIKAA